MQTVIDRALPAALQMLSRARCSGVLTIECHDKSAWIAMHDGRLLYATSDFTPRLGESLVEKGVMTADLLEASLRLQRRKRVRQPVATILVDLGLLSPEAAEEEIESQIRAVLMQVLSWKEAHLMFESWDSLPERIVLPRDGKVEPLLLQVTLLRAESEEEAATS